MPDNEIIKALECCISPDCENCPYDGDDLLRSCNHNLMIDSLALINQQKAEIERLKEAYAVYEETTGLKWARAEAIKEFAKKHKEMMWLFRDDDDGFILKVCEYEVNTDTLVKEMTEEGDNDA